MMKTFTNGEGRKWDESGKFWREGGNVQYALPCDPSLPFPADDSDIISMAKEIRAHLDSKKLTVSPEAKLVGDCKLIAEAVALLEHFGMDVGSPGRYEIDPFDQTAAKSAAEAFGFPLYTEVVPAFENRPMRLFISLSPSEYAQMFGIIEMKAE
jgi:hypothetical protein